MFKYALAVLFLISGAIAGMYFFVGVPKIYREEFPQTGIPHVYGDPENPLAEIRVFAFYFVPKNKRADVFENWQEVMGANLKELDRFHLLQFQGRSDLRFSIFPEPIIGEKDNLFYDTEVTQYGNPRALVSVSQELKRRAFGRGGDLYKSEFLSGEGGYRVILILYEGVGAIGGIIRDEGDLAQAISVFPGSVIFPAGISAVDGFMLLNRDFLTDNKFSFGASTLAHEFYHTLGIPDAYEEGHETPTSEDLMGIGRKKPIEKTYLSGETLNKLGL